MAYNKTPPRDIKIILGDFNVMVGQEEAHRAPIGLHIVQEN